MLNPSSASACPTDKSATQTVATLTRLPRSQDPLHARATNPLKPARIGLDTFPKSGLTFATFYHCTHSNQHFNHYVEAEARILLAMS